MFNILSPRGLPIYATFFLWSFGTGANQLARPLFAASFGVPLALVALVTSSNSLAHLVTGPLTGYSMDRWGRKPVLILGLILRGASLFLEFYATSYPHYLALEFVGGIGVAMFTTGGSILIADLSVRENRGRALAFRSMASRLGAIAGPIVGAGIAAGFDLRTIFLFNGFSKIVILAIVLWLVAETRPEAAVELDAAPHRRGIAFDLLVAMFMNRPFLAIAAATFAISMMQQGLFAAIFPVYATRSVGLSTPDVGGLITLAATLSLLVSLPNGFIVDLFGRKSTLVPGPGGVGPGVILAGDQHRPAVRNRHGARLWRWRGNVPRRFASVRHGSGSRRAPWLVHWRLVPAAEHRRHRGAATHRPRGRAARLRAGLRWGSDCPGRCRYRHLGIRPRYNVAAAHQRRAYRGVSIAID